jgi:hypothetical protein
VRLSRVRQQQQRGHKDRKAEQVRPERPHPHAT